MNADVQELLRLLGCPVVLAPCEAEASCAALCKAGKVYATATEDMDALTFGSPVRATILSKLQYLGSALPTRPWAAWQRTSRARC